MAAARAPVTAFGGALALGMIAVACNDDPVLGGTERGADASFIDAGADRIDGGDGRDPRADDPGPEDDTTPPDRIVDLAGEAVTHASVKVTWTAPADDAGTVMLYDFRYATTPLTTLAEFKAATIVSVPAPLAPGSSQTATVEGLTADTEYHFAVRARDKAGNYSELSNDVAVRTKVRARFLVTEIAPSRSVDPDAELRDEFIELVVIKEGAAADIEVRYAAGDATVLLHKFAALDVSAGDRFVVHVVGLPGPTGFAQEDVTGDKTSSAEVFASAEAYDVYSSIRSLIGTSSLVSVMDGATFQDAVPYSSRSGNASAPVMDAFAEAYAAGAWTFSRPPVDDSMDGCATLLEVVNGSANRSPGCGGFPGYLVPGRSLQRNGVVDTNRREDFFSAPLTRGAANARFCPPETARVAFTEVNPRAGLLELTVLESGNLMGFNIRTNPDGSGPSSGDNIVALPDLCAATQDVVVVHLGDGSKPTETASKAEYPSAAVPGYFDSAWDVATGNSVDYATTIVLAVRNPANHWLDAAAFTHQSGTLSGGFVSSLQFMQSLGRWLPAACGGAACDGSSTPSGRDVAAGWLGLGTTPETSMSRAPTAPPQASSWTLGPSTFGQ